ncbi:MAG TPA: hypothetical protein PK728_06755 [Bacillota bacterium]|nr:hypothetical protein [Bacillota bacterium]
MEPVGFSLVLASVVLFLAALGFSTRPLEKNSNGSKNTDEQRSIVVKFPKDSILPGEYTLDLKITVSGMKKGTGEKEASGKDLSEKRLRRLDEYM